MTDINSYQMTNISAPGPNDILCGRGGGTNAHPGNIKFRKLVAAHKLRYLAASKSDKPGVARDVVREWRAMDPPGRFLAKVDGTKRVPQGAGSDDDDKPTMWYDVGDKKAREKASQCLRERNGAANEAVQALVKTVTASGEACPEDYATLMNKAALVKAQNELTIQQQNEMIKMGRMQQSHMQQQQQQQSGMGMGGGGGMGNNYGRDSYEPAPMGQPSAGGSTEDDLIEAEIQRLLQQRQRQLMSGGGLTGGGYSGEHPQPQQVSSLNNSHRSGGGSDGRPMNGSGTPSNKDNPNAPQPYMGEENVMREYEALMQKQRELNMMAGKLNGMMDRNGMNGGMNGMGGGMMGSMNGNGMGMMNNNGMPEMMGNGMGMNNNGMGQGFGGGGGGGMPSQVQSNHNPDAAKDYMARLRMMRQGGDGGGGNDNHGGMANGNMPDPSFSGNGGAYGGSGGGGIMSNSNNMCGMAQGKTGQEGFTIEEYQASLQQFLSHDDSKNSARPDRMMSQHTQHAGNLSSSNAYGSANGGGGMTMGGHIQCVQVPTNLEDGSGNKRGRRSSLRSVDDMDLPIGRSTFKSVDSNDRPSFQSMDDMDIRGTFKSVDTLDMMSIGNSINEIMEDDLRQNPDSKKKYGRKSQASGGGGRQQGQQGNMASLGDFAHLPGQTLEIKTMDHGSGRGGLKKKNKQLHQLDMAQAGTRHSVQTKGGDGPSSAFGGRGSQLSMDLKLDDDDASRMSFGNMSIMSELTDFQDMLAKVQNETHNETFKNQI